MDWFLYDNGPRHERVKLPNFNGNKQLTSLLAKYLPIRAYSRKFRTAFFAFQNYLKVTLKPVSSLCFPSRITHPFPP